MTHQLPNSGLKDNHRRGKVGEFLDAKIDPGAQLSFVSAYFTLREPSRIYNEETKTTARKQTGSFYTPRPIVDYMMDGSLKAHLERV